MKHRLFGAVAVVLALSLLLSLPGAFADVTLTFFTAEAQADNTILVKWQTATEFGTTGFRLYRSESASPANWGDPITNPFAAQGTGPTGADYQYPDANVTVGVKYYYLLEELTSTGGTSTPKYGPVAAGIGIATDTPTATPTATATVTTGATATWTPRPTITPWPTATRPAPTATRRFTETPVVFQPSSTPTRAGGATTAPARAPTRTPLPAARVATPTGGALLVTVQPAIPVTATPTLISPLQPPTEPPTAQVVAVQPTEALETATPRPTKEVTPVIFAAETKPAGGATPLPSEQVAGQGGRSTSLALILGGSAIGVAGLLAAVLLFLRSRRS